MTLGYLPYMQQTIGDAMTALGYVHAQDRL
jgi:hypothetical protein